MSDPQTRENTDTQEGRWKYNRQLRRFVLELLLRDDPLNINYGEGAEGVPAVLLNVRSQPEGSTKASLAT
jgi:hypothetical protein